MRPIVTKFGGSSLADAGQFKKVRDIVRLDSRRLFVVPSAPGRRFDGDDKVTDLLYKCHSLNAAGEDFKWVFDIIRERYGEIARELSLTVDIGKYLDEVEKNIAAGASSDYCARRGEYLNGLLMADFLGYTFVDPQNGIFFGADGRLDEEKTNEVLGELLSKVESAVVPGFYGCGFDGKVKTFSRGGSDITGAIVARAVNAEVYENWTDVSGFLMADPRIVGDARSISHITYREMYELSCAGATVLHEDSVFPVSRAGISTNIRNTNMPEHPGTMISCTAVNRKDFAIFAGIAGKKGFSIILAEKDKPDNSQDLVVGTLEAIKKSGIHFDYMPSGVNNVSLLVETGEFYLGSDKFYGEMEKIKVPHYISVHDNIALIVLVGYGVIHNRETIFRIYEILRKNNIDIYMLNQGSSELSTWVGVNESHLNEAIQAIYSEFTK